MLKNTLFVVASAIAIVGSASLPAAASECQGTVNAFGECIPPEPVELPEPSTILGSMVVAGALLGKKGLDAKNASK